MSEGILKLLSDKGFVHHIGHIGNDIRHVISDLPEDYLLRPLQHENPHIARFNGGVINTASLEVRWMSIDEFERALHKNYRVPFANLSYLIGQEAEAYLNTLD